MWIDAHKWTASDKCGIRLRVHAESCASERGEDLVETLASPHVRVVLDKDAVHHMEGIRTIEEDVYLRPFDIQLKEVDRFR